MSDFIRALVEEWGVLGVALAMFLEDLFPPIPSELIMPLAGYAASQGDVRFLAVVAGGVAGSLAGAVFWFVVGRCFGKERLLNLARRHGRWVTFSPAEIEKADAWFDRHGGPVVLFGRLVPGVRTLISIPAALSGMPWGRFLAYTTIGVSIWTTALAAAGYWLGATYERVGDWLAPASDVVIAVLVCWYLYRVVTFAPRAARPAVAEEEDSG